jgi:hypothetical protein
LTSSEKQTHDGNKFLAERGEIVGAMLNFLLPMLHLKEFDDSLPVFYVDVTWAKQNHAVNIFGKIPL